MVEDILVEEWGEELHAWDVLHFTQPGEGAISKGENVVFYWDQRFMGGPGVDRSDLEVIIYEDLVNRRQTLLEVFFHEIALVSLPTALVHNLKAQLLSHQVPSEVCVREQFE